MFILQTLNTTQTRDYNAFFTGTIYEITSALDTNLKNYRIKLA